MPGGGGPHGGGGGSPLGGCSHHTEASEPGLRLSIEVAAARAAPEPGCAIFLMETPPWGGEGSQRWGGFMPGGTAACPSRSVLLLVLCDRCHVGTVVWGPSAHGPGLPHGVHTHSVNSFLHQALLYALGGPRFWDVGRR